VRVASARMPRVQPASMRLAADSHARERIGPRRGRELPLRTRVLK
jgi:hypothetical protein